MRPGKGASWTYPDARLRCSRYRRSTPTDFRPIRVRRSIRSTRRPSLSCWRRVSLDSRRSLLDRRSFANRSTTKHLRKENNSHHYFSNETKPPTASPASGSGCTTLFDATWRLASATITTLNLIKGAAAADNDDDNDD